MTTPRAPLLRLLEVALAVAAERRAEPVLQTVLDAARDLTGARYAAVGVPDGSGQMAMFLTSGIDAATWDAIGYLPTRHGLLGTLLDSPEPIRLADIRGDPRFSGWPAGHPEMRSFLGVPILAGGEILAELYLTDKAGAPTFTEDDQQLVETLAAHAALALVNAQRLEAVRELSVAGERTRLARDLHDSVTQMLFSLSLSAESAATMAGSAETAGAEAPAATDRLVRELDRIRALAGEALAELHSLVGTLRAPDLDREGLAAALRKRVDLLARVHEVTIEMAVAGEPGGRSWTVDHQLLRIAQEALGNALRHAGATRIRIALEGGDRIRLEVDDDGSGFDLAATSRASRRLGLTSMRERAEALGGTLSVSTAPGQGTTVTVEVPAG
ncbi:MAG: GAF domain-containing sensor histidine kinase [Actinomycetota bacterium]|nr:GAF domain-containing sensor histidine kinase [Actinomycetota bacterium]